MTLDLTTRTFVRQRAKFRCEYCGISESVIPFVPFHVEHIIAQQHLRDNRLENLALACDRCNAYKGSNLSSIDPGQFRSSTCFIRAGKIGQIIFLSHPASFKAGRLPVERLCIC